MSPHQVASIGATSYTYDAQGRANAAGAGCAGAADALGNQILAHSDITHDRNIRFDTEQQAFEIVKGDPNAPTLRTRFWYGPDGARYKRVNLNGQRTLYVGGLEIVTSGAVSTTKRYIGGVAVQDVVNGIASTKYLFGDQIGSVETITNSTGTVLERLDYAPFGERRNPSAPLTYLASYSPSTTTHGFTGQEEVDGSDVVHFNGRLYDPNIGKFLQADPIIQEPGNPQNYNRYT